MHNILLLSPFHLDVLMDSMELIFVPVLSSKTEWEVRIIAFQVPDNSVNNKNSRTLGRKRCVKGQLIKKVHTLQIYLMLNSNIFQFIVQLRNSKEF